MDKITVLMAVYNPQIDWFEKQLNSIDNQTYPNLELIICDDCSTKLSFEELQSIVGSCIKKIPCRLYQNETNLGSTKTFECLTSENTGEYFAYCDQDDIWDLTKLYKEWVALSSCNGCMACTNADAIDAADNLLSTGFMSIPHSFRKQIAAGCAWKTLLTKNHFWGCTMLIKAKAAKESLPFIDGMYHDHYMELYASMNGKIMFLDEALVRYRLHDNNQTGFLKGISSKQEYYYNRIHPLSNRYRELLNRRIKDEYRITVKGLLKWAESRERYAKGEWICCIGMIKGIRYNVSTTLFELLTMQMSERMWREILAKMKKVKKLQFKDRRK